MPAAFEKLAVFKPEALRAVDKLFSHQTGFVHLANSVACSRAIEARYPATKPIAVYNCAEVPEPFDRLTVPSIDPPLVLAIGTIQPLKGTDLFVETAIKVCREHPTVEFCWLGEGPEYGSWRKSIEAARLTNRIVFPGYIRAPYLLLRRASVLFVPSRQESFSQATAEAMCLGRKVVTFESGGPPEILGGHGLVVPGFSTDAAAVTILRLLRGSQDALVDAGARERYLQLFTAEVHAKRLDRTIRACLSGKSVPEYPAMTTKRASYGTGDIVNVD
jgi:glycosyltransferase involved in cell wall biosynthesis